MYIYIQIHMERERGRRTKERNSSEIEIGREIKETERMKGKIRDRERHISRFTD